jgi:hypothetical protein
MAKRLKYDYNMLKQICDDHNVTLLHDYSQDYVTRDTRILGKCLYCDKSFCKSLNKIHKQRNFGCLECAQDLKFERIKATMLEKYDVEYAAQSEIFLKKQQETCLQVYGVKNACQSEEVKNKIKQTNIERYGCRYGLSNQDIIAKREETNLLRYGVKNQLQRAEIQRRVQQSSFKLKKFTFPSGRIEQIQGFEHFALNDLLFKHHFSEDNIVVGETVPTITYFDCNNVERKHFVDIFLPKENKCIEVKSKFTLGLQNDKIFLKQKFAKQAGFLYEIWVYNIKGEIIEKYI